jgi:hypothetical protein
MREDVQRRGKDPEISRILALETVPPVTTSRWFPRHKAQVVAAVDAGLLSAGEACQLYRLTEEEFAGWQRAIAEAGVSGLRVSRRRDASRPGATLTLVHGRA